MDIIDRYGSMNDGNIRGIGGFNTPEASSGSEELNGEISGDDEYGVRLW